MNDAECTELRAAIRAYLDLIEVGAGSVDENEARLPRILDRLALAQHATSETVPTADAPKAPRKDQVDLRAQICERFPNYGFYNTALAPLDVPSEEWGLADAIDDLLDVANDLYAVEWHWEHTGEADAVWSLRHDYEVHWGLHLRSLQHYLQVIQSGMFESN